MQSKWWMGEAVIKQAIATTIPDSLFINVHKEVMVCLMCEAVWLKQEKKSQMVTVICTASCRQKNVLSMVICVLTLISCRQCMRIWPQWEHLYWTKIYFNYSWINPAFVWHLYGCHYCCIYYTTESSSQSYWCHFQWSRLQGFQEP